MMGTNGEWKMILLDNVLDTILYTLQTHQCYQSVIYMYVQATLTS